MVHRVQIEQFYENMEEATIGRWLKAEGESVAEKEKLVEIITDKVTFEMESPAGGQLLRIVTPPRSVVIAGTTIALIGDDGEPLPDVDAENEALLQQREQERQAAEAAAAAAQPAVRAPRRSREGRVRAVPQARRLARAHGIDVAEVAARYGLERVQTKDVERFLAEQDATP